MRSDGPAFLPNTKPYVAVLLSSKGGIGFGSYAGMYTTEDLLVFVETIEEPYTGSGVVRIRDPDGTISAQDFRGARCDIGWGWLGAGMSLDEPRWVSDQVDISMEGQLLVELRLVNVWQMLDFSTGLNIGDESGQLPAAGSTRTWERTKTCLGIIQEVLSDENGWLAQWGMTGLTILNQDDVVDTYKPFITTEINDADRTILRRVLEMTECVITFRSDGGATLNYIDPSNPGPYYNYAIDQVQHPFFIHTRGRSLPIPNRVFFVDALPNLAQDTKPTYVGVAEDEDSMKYLGKLARVFEDDSIESDDEANSRARTKLARIKSESEQGDLYVPMNAVVELYDEIQVTDARGGPSVIARVGRIERQFHDSRYVQDQRDSYSTGIKLGGLGGGSTVIKHPAGGANDIEATISDFRSRSLEDPFKGGGGGNVHLLGPFIIKPEDWYPLPGTPVGQHKAHVVFLPANCFFIDYLVEMPPPMYLNAFTVAELDYLLSVGVWDADSNADGWIIQGEYQDDVTGDYIHLYPSITDLTLNATYLGVTFLGPLRLVGPRELVAVCGFKYEAPIWIWVTVAYPLGRKNPR